MIAACSTNDAGWDADAVCPITARGTFIDARDGEVYRYTTIGNQVWMAENLKYEDSTSFCFYTEDNCKEKGRIYPHHSALVLCPNGWHLPSQNEWETLIENMGGEKVAGYKLKATYGWSPLNPGDNPNGSDDCGFAALPSNASSAKDDGHTLSFWIDNTLISRMHSFEDEFYLTYDERNYMYAVRCIKN